MSKCFTRVIVYSGICNLTEFKHCLIFIDRSWAWKQFCSSVGLFEIHAPLLGAPSAQEIMAFQVVSLMLFALILIAILSSREHGS